ncbi:G-patch domain-containing protein [Aphelenchoides fujianensis]|nr:G-patch domain-containing protein [Aphelenchoides fujianensis]
MDSPSASSTPAASNGHEDGANSTEIPAAAAPPAEAPRIGISFGITRQVRSLVVTTGGQTTATLEETIEHSVTHLENGLVNGKQAVKKDEPVITPVAQAANWRIERLQKLADEGTATDEQRALLELLLESTGQKAIDLQLPSDDIRLESAAGAKEAEEPEDPDYDAISFADFGPAFLRGHGWRKGEGIGKTNKREVPLSVQAKGRGFDLGISKKKRAAKNGEGDDEPDIPMGKGVAVRVIGGKFDGQFGRVLAFDAAAGRCDLRMADGAQRTIVETLLQTIGEKEYADRGKVLNKPSYEKYEKRENGRDDRLEASGRENRRDDRDRRDDRRDDRSSRKEAEKDVEIIAETPRSSVALWVAPELRVRVISRDYKDGRYFKQKMRVVDAADRDHCELRDDSGRIHTLKQKHLETVIPKGRGGQVMIVAGKHRGQVGQVVERDDRRYQLDVRMLGRRDVIKADFDDVCEFCGSLEEMEH